MCKNLLTELFLENLSVMLTGNIKQLWLWVHWQLTENVNLNVHSNCEYQMLTETFSANVVANIKSNCRTVNRILTFSLFIITEQRFKTMHVNWELTEMLTELVVFVELILGYYVCM